VSSEIELSDELTTAWLLAWVGKRPFSESSAHDVQYEDPLAHEPLRGIDALETYAANVREALPDLRLERTGEPLTGGAYACIPWRAAGTHKNGTSALPATNRFVTVHGMHYVELSDGLVRRARGFFDLYDAGTQLGLLPSRGGVGESLLLLLRGFGLRST
jgi:SnoaL-like polyketide cyclase